MNATIWAEIEGGTGIMCACLPTLWKPLTRLLKKRSPRDSDENTYTLGSFHQQQPWSKHNYKSAAVAAPIMHSGSQERILSDNKIDVTKTVDVVVGWRENL